jgi:O-antigen/teichoic acid export membrane protein
MSFLSYGLQTVFVRLSLAFVTFGIGIINARWLGPEGVGVVALLLLVKTFAFRFGNLGFGSSFAFFTARRMADFRHMVSLSNIISLILSGLCILVFSIFWKSPLSPWNDIGFLDYVIALVALPFCFYNNYIQRILSGRFRITQINIANAVSVVLQLSFVILLVAVMNYGVPGAIFASLLSDITMTIILFIHVRHEQPDEMVDVQQLAQDSATSLLKNLWNYGCWNYFLMFSNLLVEEVPLVLLKKFTGDNGLIGFYSRARSVGRQSRLVVEPFAQMLFPFTASSSKDKSTNRTNILCRNSILIMTLVMIVLMIFIKPIISLLYGEEFLPAADIFIALAPGVIVFPFGHFLEIHVAASGRPRDIFIASVSTLVAAIGICWILIPNFGSVGAGLSVSLIYFVRALFRFIAYVRMTRTSIWEILLPSWQDLIYYQMLLRSIFSVFARGIRWI